VPVISHSRVGRAVKHCQRPGHAAGGPTIRLVLSESGHSCRGWRDNSRKHIVSNDAILWASSPFLTQRAKLARVLSNIKGTHSLQSDDFSTEIPSGFWCSSFLCYPNTHKVFRRLCLLLNASNWVLRARKACSFGGAFDSWLKLFRIVFFGPAVPSSYSRLGFGPSNCLFRASSAFKLFEAGLRSLELSFSA
jgi:hypothetical protein